MSVAPASAPAMVAGKKMGNKATIELGYMVFMVFNKALSKKSMRRAPSIWKDPIQMPDVTTIQ
jgi:hypothetical protein